MRIPARSRWSGLKPASSSCAASVSPIRTRTWSARPRTSTVNTCSPASSRSRSCARANSASGFVEAALAEAQHAAGVVDHDLGPGVGRRAETLLRAREMALGFREAPHPHERHAGHRERAGRHRLVGPAMLLGNRDRPLAQLERKRQRLPGERRRDCEVREAADLDEGP